MGTRAIGIVLCRISAILLFVLAARNVGFAIPTLSRFDGSILATFQVMILMLVMPVGAGLLLWFFADRICRVDIDAPPPRLDESLRADDLVAIGTLLIGIYTFAFALVEASYVETSIATQESGLGARSGIADHFLPQRVSYLVQLLLGGFFVFGRRTIAAVAVRARRIGTDGSG